MPRQDCCCSHRRWPCDVKLFVTVSGWPKLSFIRAKYIHASLKFPTLSCPMVWTVLPFFRGAHEGTNLGECSETHLGGIAPANSQSTFCFAFHLSTVVVVVVVFLCLCAWCFYVDSERVRGVRPCCGVECSHLQTQANLAAEICRRVDVTAPLDGVASEEPVWVEKCLSEAVQDESKAVQRRVSNTWRTGCPGCNHPWTQMPNGS